MTGVITFEMVTFIVGVVGTVLMLWWRVESRIRTSDEKQKKNRSNNDLK